MRLSLVNDGPVTLLLEVWSSAGSPGRAPATRPGGAPVRLLWRRW